jgi:hypothetical protein
VFKTSKKKDKPKLLSKKTKKDCEKPKKKSWVSSSKNTQKTKTIRRRVGRSPKKKTNIGEKNEQKTEDKKKRDKKKQKQKKKKHKKNH